ncbi:hypothetical protein Tco_1308298, partial [Tanacetum coccineum]
MVDEKENNALHIATRKGHNEMLSGDKLVPTIVCLAWSHGMVLTDLCCCGRREPDIGKSVATSVTENVVLYEYSVLT